MILSDAETADLQSMAGVGEIICCWFIAPITMLGEFLGCIGLYNVHPSFLEISIGPQNWLSGVERAMLSNGP